MFNTMLLTIYTLELFLSSSFTKNFIKKDGPVSPEHRDFDKRISSGTAEHNRKTVWFGDAGPAQFVHGRGFVSQVKSGFAMVMRVPGSVECVSHTLPPITEPFPITTAPRMVAPA